MAVENLGQVGAFYKGTTPPTNTDLIWLDISSSPAVFMVYDSTQSAWVNQADVSVAFPLSAPVQAGITNPQFTFDGDDDTGITSISPNQFQLVTNGVNRVTVSTTIFGVLQPISSLSGNLELVGTGSNTVEIEGIEYPNTDGSSGDVMTTNGSGVITFQNLGDIDFEPPHGEVYISTAIETVISTVNTPVKALGTTTSLLLQDFDTNSVSNRLRYTGTTTKVFEIVVSLSLTTAGNNKIIGLYLAKNGILDATTEIIRKVSTGGDVGSASLSGLESLDTNDYIEVWVENQTDDTNLTLDKLNMSIK